MANKDIQTALAQTALAKLLSPIDWSKVVSVDKSTKQILVGGKPIDAARQANLKAEAELFLQSDLWQLIIETPKALAQEEMFVKGESLESLQKGRSMLYTLDAQKNVLMAFKPVIHKP